MAEAVGTPPLSEAERQQLEQEKKPKKAMYQEEDLYKQISQKISGKRGEPVKINKVVAEQIARDINRTFPDNILFATDSKIKQSLTRVLHAFSIRSPSIGYCQSMNFITAALLLLGDEEFAFDHLTIIVERLFPEYFTRSMEGLQVDQAILQQLIDEKLPKLAAHLKSVGMEFSVMSTKWFLCLFLNCVPFTTAIRFWDLIFTGGSSMLISIAFALLRHFEAQILAQDNFMDVSILLNKSLANLYDYSQIIEDVFHQNLASKIASIRPALQNSISERIKKQQMVSLNKLNFTLEDLRKIRAKFLAAGHHESVSKAEFKALLDTSMGSLGDQKVEEKLFDFFDSNGDGVIDFKEYCIGLSQASKGSAAEKVKYFFEVFDTNGDGGISKTELQKILAWQFKMMGYQGSKSMAQFHADESFPRLDGNSDGKLSLEEFEKCWLSQPLLVRSMNEDVEEAS